MSRDVSLRLVLLSELLWAAKRTADLVLAATAWAARHVASVLAWNPARWTR